MVLTGMNALPDNHRVVTVSKIDLASLLFVSFIFKRVFFSLFLFSMKGDLNVILRADFRD